LKCGKEYGVFKGDTSKHVLEEQRNISKNEPEKLEKFRGNLENAKGYAQVWQIVKDSVSFAFGKHRGNMMLFIDHLPLQIGAYYPLGTNNIVLNRHLVDIMEAKSNNKKW
jgi:hypothetical protein